MPDNGFDILQADFAGVAIDVAHVNTAGERFSRSGPGRADKTMARDADPPEA